MSSNRPGQRGSGNPAILFGLAGTLLVAAGGLAGGYYVVSTRSEARAATRPAPPKTEGPRATNASPTPALEALLATSVELKTGSATVKKTWAELGIEIDPGELGRAPINSDNDLKALAAKGSIPVRLDRDKAIK